jgi:hypothetical protein
MLKLIGAIIKFIFKTIFYTTLAFVGFIAFIATLGKE